MIRESQICNYIKLIKRLNKQRLYKKRANELRNKNLSQPTCSGRDHQNENFPSSFCELPQKKNSKIYRVVKPNISEMELRLDSSHYKKKNLYSQYCEDLQKKFDLKDSVKLGGSSLFVKLIRHPLQRRNKYENSETLKKSKYLQKKDSFNPPMDSDRINTYHFSDFRKTSEPRLRKQERKVLRKQVKGYVLPRKQSLPQNNIYHRLTPKQKINRRTTECFEGRQAKLKKRGNPKIDPKKMEEYEDQFNINFGRIQGWIQNNQTTEYFSKMDDEDFFCSS